MNIRHSQSMTLVTLVFITSGEFYRAHMLAKHHERVHFGLLKM